MAYKVFAAGTGQAVQQNNITVIAVDITAAAADASAIVYSNGTPLIYISAAAKDSNQKFFAVAGSHMGVNLESPVTIDVTGVGAHVAIEF